MSSSRTEDGDPGGAGESRRRFSQTRGKAYSGVVRGEVLEASWCFFFAPTSPSPCNLFLLTFSFPYKLELSQTSHGEGTVLHPYITHQPRAPSPQAVLTADQLAASAGIPTTLSGLIIGKNARAARSTELRKMLVAQLCPNLCDRMDYGPLGSSFLGILQARIPEWVAIPFSRGSLTQGWNPDLLHCRQILYHPSHL